MSRSYKKNPVYHGGGWLSKKQANKILRAKLRSADFDDPLPQRNLYRRYNEQYNINDYINWWSLRMARADWLNNQRLRNQYETENDFINHCWAKTQERK